MPRMPRSMDFHILLAILILSLFLVGVSSTTVPLQEPQLDGQRFRITVVEEGSFLTISKEVNEDKNNDGRLSFSGYVIDMLQALAIQANFTYEFLTPSGYGPHCVPQLTLPNATADTTTTNIEENSHSVTYRTQYNCGTNDVNELQGTPYGTDLYLSMYYVSPERQLKNWFTIPFQPPSKGTQVMYGTATGIPNIQSLVEQQVAGLQPPACIPGSTANVEFMQGAFPELQFENFYGSEQDVYESMVSGRCPIHIVDSPLARQFTFRRAQAGECFAAGMPIGVIGEPMESGLSHYAIGVGKHLDREVVDTLSYYMNLLMVDGTLAAFYKGQGGTGTECGYVLYPEDGDESLLSVGAIVGIVLGAVAIVTIPLIVWHFYKLRRQEKRYKKRFVQQIARNIEIGRQPGCIPPDKLSEEILHIGQGKEVISKADMSKWMHDIKMNFISDEDFEALWNAIDIDGKGEVNAVEFIVFLSACGPEFEEVYDEQANMPKVERLKLATRRLTNLTSFGEDGVRQLEQKLERSSRQWRPQSASFSSRGSVE